MNRLPVSAVEYESTDALLGHLSIENDGGRCVIAGTPHPTSLFAPLHYEPNYAYPLLVWLHRAGKDENELREVMPLISLRNYVAVAVRGTVEQSLAPSRVGYCWSQTAAHVAAADQAVCEAIELAKRRFNVAPQKVFLAGCGAGGTMALRLALANPESFAGVLSLGGSLPNQGRPLLRIAQARRLPLLIACGQDSVQYNSAQVCDNLRLLHSAGMTVDLRQYPCADELLSAMLSDIDRWMMQRVVGASTAGALA
jgi:phospholipase/carboxylesterase